MTRVKGPRLVHEITRRPPRLSRGYLAETYDGIGQYVMVTMSRGAITAAFRARIAAGDFGGGRTFPAGTPVVIFSNRGQLEVFLGNIPIVAGCREDFNRVLDTTTIFDNTDPLYRSQGGLPWYAIPFTAPNVSIDGEGAIWDISAIFTTWNDSALYFISPDDSGEAPAPDPSDIFNPFNAGAITFPFVIRYRLRLDAPLPQTVNNSNFNSIGGYFYTGEATPDNSFPSQDYAGIELDLTSIAPYGLKLFILDTRAGTFIEQNDGLTVISDFKDAGWAYVQYRVDDTGTYAKAWLDGDNEPTDYQVWIKQSNIFQANFYFIVTEFFNMGRGAGNFDASVAGNVWKVDSIEILAGLCGLVASS